MAKFSVNIPLEMDWRGLSIHGAAGATHRIPDAHYDEFVAEFVTGKASTLMPGLTWIVQDEATAVAGEHPDLATHEALGLSDAGHTHPAGDHPDLATHDTLGLATQVELDAHTAAGDPHTAYALDADLSNHEGAADPHTGYVREADANWIDLTDSGETALHSHAAGAGAPTDADYLVGTANAGLSAEIVVGTSPGGELGGTWGSPTVDATHSGSTHAATQAAAEATAASALSTHEAAADPHAVYLKETDFDDVDFLVGTATGFTAAEIVVGTSPGGELGGTWASPTVDATHSGSAHHTQAHSIVSADHSTTGLTAGQFLQATTTAAFSFAAVAFSRGGTLIQADGLTAAVNIIVWRAPFACTITAVKGYRVGGTGATVNARRNGSSNHLASAVSVSSADTWTDGGAVQNTAYVAGDKLEIMVVSVTGSPTQVAVQVDFTRP